MGSNRISISHSKLYLRPIRVPGINPNALAFFNDRKHENDELKRYCSEVFEIDEEKITELIMSNLDNSTLEWAFCKRHLKLCQSEEKGFAHSRPPIHKRSKKTREDKILAEPSRKERLREIEVELERLERIRGGKVV